MVRLQVSRDKNEVSVSFAKLLQLAGAGLPFAVRQEPRGQHYARIKSIAALGAVISEHSRHVQPLDPSNNVMALAVWDDKVIQAVPEHMRLASIGGDKTHCQHPF